MGVFMKPTYNFPVLRGIQAGAEYYLTMCPLKLVPKLFIFDEEIVPPELRAQRTLNKARIPEMAQYISKNPNEYVFSAITASIGTEVEYNPIIEAGADKNLGNLSIPMDAKIIINDGQHRRAAIEEALKYTPELGNETIAVVFFIDAGLRKSQQMFADLNKHAVRPSQSLGILYDHRDPLAKLSRSLIEDILVFNRLTEKEKTSISNRSPKLFTLSSIYQANSALLRKKKKQTINDKEKELATEYWLEVTKLIPEWEMAKKKEISCALLREEYIHSHGIALVALGGAGADLLANDPDNWKSKLQSLKSVDWSRSNTKVWEGRAMLQGKISRAKRQVDLTVIYLKRIFELPISADEEKLESILLSDRK
jgi:DNA sulfur modification protein DndB